MNTRLRWAMAALVSVAMTGLFAVLMDLEPGTMDSVIAPLVRSVG